MREQFFYRFLVFKEKLKDFTPSQFRKLFLSLLFVAAIPFTLFAVQQRQELRQHAAVEGLYDISTSAKVITGSSFKEGKGFIGEDRITYLQLGSPKVSFGAAVKSNNISNNRGLLDLYNFNSVTVANGLKTTLVLSNVNSTNYTDTSQWNWQEAEYVINGGGFDDSEIVGHALVWHVGNPTWMNNLSNDQLKSLLQLYVTTVVRKYCNKIAIMEVVNEAFDDNGNPQPAYGSSIWLRAFGNSDYIKFAYGWAHTACPSMKLYLGDYKGEEKNGKANGILRYIKQARAEGYQIDGYAMQTHQGNIAGQYEYGFTNLSSLAQNIQQFNEAGIDIAISEYDYILNNPADVQKQVDQVRAIAQVCYNAPNCKRFTTWGVTDKDSSYLSLKSDGYTPLLFDMNFQPKAAYWAVREALHLP